jgi:hypothetical protein
VSHELWRDSAIGSYGYGWDGRGGGWAGLAQVVLVRCRRQYLNGRHPDVVEDHYYLTSLRPEQPQGTPAALLALVRGHWEIENGLHHVKDRSLGEDAQRARPGATVLARLRSLAVGLLQHVDGASTPLKQIKVFAHPLLGLRLLKRKRLPKIKERYF